MRPAFSILVFIVLSVGCTKSIEKDKLYIRGRLFLTDTITQNLIDKPMSGKKVKVSTNLEDSINYAYQVTTDADGYFVFNLLSDDVDSLRLQYEDTINGYIYTGTEKVKRGVNNIAFHASFDLSRQSGIHLIATDNSGGRIPSAVAWVYNNFTLFNSDTSGAGKIFDINLNADGIGNKIPLTPGTYYIRIKTTIGNLKFNGTLPNIIVEKNKVTPVVMTLQQDIPINGFTLTILDNASSPVSGAQVYAYRSKTTFLLDSNHANSLFNLSSNSGGRASYYNIDAARYYLRIKKQVGNVTLYGMDSIDVASSSTTLKQIFLIQQPPNNIINGFTVTILDNQNTPVNSAQVYAYKSKTIWQLDSSYTNGLFNISSDINGKASYYNIEAARYYLRIKRQIGNVLLQKLDSVDVNSSSISLKTIFIN